MGIDRTKYVTIEEASNMLEIEGTYSSWVAGVNALNLRWVKIDKNKKLYLKEDLEKEIIRILDFFEKYCTPDEYGLKDSTLKKRKLDSIPMPSGFNVMFYKRRYGDNPFKSHRNCYLRSDVVSIVGADKESHNIEDYISTSETISILGMSSLSNHVQRNALKSLQLKKYKADIGEGLKTCYSRAEVENISTEIKTFFDNYCSVGESSLADYIISSNLESIPMPKGYNQAFYEERTKSSKYVSYLVAYKKDDVKQLENRRYVSNENKDNNKKFEDKYISLDEATEFLNVGRNVFRQLRKEVDFKEIKHKGKIYLNKEVCNEILNKRKEFLDEYIDTQSLKDRYINGKDHRLITNFIDKHPVPAYALTRDNAIAFNTAGAYKIKDIEDYLESRKKTLIIEETEDGKKIKHLTISDIESDTPFNTFKARLNYFYNWDGFMEDPEYTSNRWFVHVEKKLKNSNCSEHIMSSKINSYVQCTLLLKDMLVNNNKIEVYMLTSGEINLFLRGIETLIHATYLYYFIKEVHQEIINEYGNNKIAYKINNIKKPPRLKDSNGSDNVSNDDVIYKFDTYAEVFKYQLKTGYHITNALNEIEANGTATYASTWLYVMLHLNNAWRNGDVRDFPSVNIDDLLVSFEIYNLDWFKENTLSLPKARGIISRVIQWEILISKTKIEGHFFCSDELAPALASAIIILTLYKRTQNVVSDERLIHFNTKHNLISQRLLNIFFKELEVDGFKFKSKKFNKTVMTYITYLANLSGDKKALEYAKYMRSHSRISSTLHYIDFNVEAVEKLSEYLFARGEFGYVTSLLLKRLNGGEILNFEETTEQIYLVNQMFGDITKMSTTIGFLNTIRGDRVSVAKYIAEKSFEECQKILTDLFARKLPSKDGSDVQCLFSKVGCQRTELKSCFDCQYHIPTIYALTSLCEAILNDMRRYNKSTSMPSKYKLALSIHRKKVDLSDALKKFGSEYVFNCLGIDKEVFIDILSEIPNPLQISNN